MASEQPKRVAVRSYGGVLDTVERRIFKIDRWRIPHPQGLSVRALTYTGAAFVAFMVLGQLPVVAQVLGILPPSLRFFALPVAVGWGLSAWAPDGRSPHHALVSALRYLPAPKSLAGLRACPAEGRRIAPLDGVTVASAGDESRYRPGRVVGPATVVLRYPASVTAEGAPRRVTDAGERAALAKRLVITPAEGRAKALPVGHQLRIPAGKEVVFR